MLVVYLGRAGLSSCQYQGFMPSWSREHFSQSHQSTVLPSGLEGEKWDWTFHLFFNLSVLFTLQRQ